MASLLVKIAIGALGAGIVTTTAVQVMAGPVEGTAGGSVEASVVKVVDGDTLDVRYGDDIHRVRLLNVDAPESKDPNRPVECLGQEASTFLADQLPAGTEVTLQFDVDLLDPYDRELAGVLKGDVLINAEIARAGLGVPAYFAPNKRFLSEVESAHAQARAHSAGLYDPTVECSIPAQVAQLESAQQQAGDTPAEGASAAAIATYLENLEADRGRAAAVLLLLGGDVTLVPLAGYSPTELTSMTARVHDLDTTWRALQKTWEDKHDKAVEQAAEEARHKAEAERQAEEKAQREAEEAAQREAEEEAQREAEATAQREAERTAEREAKERADWEAAQQREADEARRQAPHPAPAPAPSPQPAPAPPPAPSPPPAANPGAGYTGCRAYIGGPYIDDKGRHYTPIDCDTRLPLVP